MIQMDKPWRFRSRHLLDTGRDIDIGVTAASRIVWHGTDDGVTGGRYRIRRDPSTPSLPWRLEVAPGGRSSTSPWQVRSYHQSQSIARRFAERLERDRIRRVRVWGHAALGTAAAIGAGAALANATRIEIFALGVAGTYFALLWLFHSAAVLVANAWNWPLDDSSPETLTWSDRLVLRIAARRTEEQVQETTEQAVSVLPPTGKT